LRRLLEFFLRNRAAETFPEFSKRRDFAEEVGRR
jgi:hypothetical protein